VTFSGQSGARLRSAKFHALHIVSEFHRLIERLNFVVVSDGLVLVSDVLGATSLHHVGLGSALGCREAGASFQQAVRLLDVAKGEALHLVALVHLVIARSLLRVTVTFELARPAHTDGILGGLVQGGLFVGRVLVWTDALSHC